MVTKTIGCRFSMYEYEKIKRECKQKEISVSHWIRMRIDYANKKDDTRHLVIEKLDRSLRQLDIHGRGDEFIDSIVDLLDLLKNIEDENI